METNYYVYYSYEPWGRGYIGYRKCPKGLTPKTDKYLGSFRDKCFKPTEKIILFQELTKEEAIEIEIKLHAFYNVKNNDHFANMCNAISTGFNYSGPKKGEGNPIYGKIKINNGIVEKLISPLEEIPEGFIIGRKSFSEETRQKQSKAQSGKKESWKTKKKKSEAMKGENNPNYRCFGENHPRYGQYHTDESKKKISVAMRGKNSIGVQTSLCCYLSVGIACKELKISKPTFYKLFEKDLITGFYVEKG